MHQIKTKLIEVLRKISCPKLKKYLEHQHDDHFLSYF